MAVRVPLHFAKPTMRLARPIFDRDGRLVAGNGTLLNERVARLLRKMALQSVVVEETEDLPAWEMIRPVEQQLLELEERFRWEEPTKALDAIRQAISRRLLKRAADLENDPALAAERDPDTASPGFPEPSPVHVPRRNWNGAQGSFSFASAAKADKDRKRTVVQKMIQRKAAFLM